MRHYEVLNVAFCLFNSLLNLSQIMSYLHAYAQHFNILKHIRYGHRVVSVHWDNDKQKWLLNVQCNDG